MKITEIKSDLLNEKYYQINHDSGLTIYVYEKPDYNSTYAIFGTKYGSINRTFSKDGGEVTTVPDGIAHFLEHKLFEAEEGDAFTRYAKTGANANAYTSFDKTCYLFSCTENFEESLTILLDFVQSPYFTKETVDKEQGIIGQEIKMYDDSPSWRVMFNMLEAMYENHPVKIDIAGTVESIAKITPEYLYSCYNTFYNLHNMVLCVAGKATVDDVLKVADKMLKKSEKHTVESVFEKEPSSVSQHYVEQKLPVALPLFNFGYKENAEHRPSAEETAYTDILLFMLASQNSKMYRDLLDNNLINSSFSYEFFEGEGFACTMFGGESRNPKAAAKMIADYIEKTKNDGIDESEFEIAKKSVYGEIVSSLNSVDSIANMIADGHLSKKELYSYIEAVANAKISDIESRLDFLMNKDYSVLSVINGMEDL